MSKKLNQIKPIEKCGVCGTDLLLRGCEMCGAPVCCPKCCDEAAQEQKVNSANYLTRANIFPLWALPTDAEEFCRLEYDGKLH